MPTVRSFKYHNRARVARLMVRTPMNSATRQYGVAGLGNSGDRLRISEVPEIRSLSPELPRTANASGTATEDSFPSKARTKNTIAHPMRRSASAINARREKKQASSVDRSYT